MQDNTERKLYVKEKVWILQIHGQMAKKWGKNSVESFLANPHLPPSVHGRLYMDAWFYTQRSTKYS